MSKLKPPTEAVLPFVELPRPLQESGVIGKGGAAGFLGKAYDPYRLYQDPAKPIKTEDLALRKETPPERLKDRFELLKGINESMPDLEKALKSYAIDEYYGKAFDLVLSGKARDAFDLTKEPDTVRERYGKTTFGQGLLLSRRLIEAGTRFVQMNWPAVANGNPEIDAWDTHAANFGPLKNLHCPKLDRGLSALLEDMNDRGMLKETLVVAIGEFGRSPRIGVSTSGNSNAPDGRDHWPYCYSGVIAGCGIARGAQYGESDQTASSPKDKPVHPNDLLATVYYALGIDPDMIVLNHLNQPRELVKGKRGNPVFGFPRFPSAVISTGSGLRRFTQRLGLLSMQHAAERVEPSDHQRAIEDFVIAVVRRSQSERLAPEGFTDKDSLALPKQIPLFHDAAHEDTGVVLHFRYAPRKHTRRFRVATGRCLILQRLVRTILVIPLLPSMKCVLLPLRIARRRLQRVLLQSAMHALMTAVVLGRGRSAPLGHNA